MDQTQTQTQAQAQAQAGRSERWGPEIYLHLEFRVSFGKKDPSAKNHQVTYRSRNLRERTPAFPRQVPAPNTNYLAAIRNFDQRQSRIRELRQNYFNSHPNRHHQMQEYYQSEQPRPQLQVPIIREPQRPTRADSRPSHGRGRSAPPPFGENPWDVNISPDSTSPTTVAELRRKPLPAPPSQFRLGEGGQPWSTWSMPVGYDPDTHPKDDDDAESQVARLRSSLGPTDRNSTTYATNPTMVSTFSPEHLPPGPAPRDLETGRARELGALSAAMMTVDNGFENQWWYQGRRAPTSDAGDADDRNNDNDLRTPDDSPVQRWSAGPMASTPMSPLSSTPMRWLPGSAVGTGTWTTATGTGTMGGVGGAGAVVSPITDVPFSPVGVQVPTSLLQRTMSTRSEELWFSTEKGR